MTARVDGLEVARGADGFLRGEPEPMLVVAAGVCDDDGARTGARHVVRFATPRRLPAVLTPREAARLTVTVRHGAGAFFLLAAAIEEDGGGTIERVFAALEQTDLLELVHLPAGGAIPHVLSLAEACGSWRGPRTVDLISAGVRVSAVAAPGKDDWINAVFCVWSAKERVVEDARLHFVSPDERNDWTALLSVKTRVRWG